MWFFWGIYDCIFLNNFKLKFPCASVCNCSIQKKLVFVIGIFFSIVCFNALFFFKIFRKLWNWYTVSNLAWLSQTYLLYVSGTKFAATAFYIVLSSKCCKIASDITTINAKPIEREFSKIRTYLSKIK